MRKRGLCSRPVSVSLSVGPSVTLVYCIHLAEDNVKLLSRQSSPIILVFDTQHRYPIPREPLQLGVGTQNTWGWENCDFR